MKLPSEERVSKVTGLDLSGRHCGIAALVFLHRGSASQTISAARIGDKFGESLGGSQAPPSFWEVLGLPRKFPELPRKFFGDFPGSSLTVELNSNPEVPRKFPKLPRKFPDFPGGQPLSLRSLTPSPDSQKFCLRECASPGFLHRIASPFPGLPHTAAHIASLPASRDMGHSGLDE